jgi:cation:H+ antiporter
VIGNASLVTGNLFGGVALQVTVLAVVDGVAVRGALTYVAPQRVLLFQGVMLLLMLALALAGAAAREPISVLGIGLTPLVVTIGYVVTLRVVSSGKYLPRWRPTDSETALGRSQTERSEDGELRMSNRALYLWTGTAGLGILVAGTAVALTGDALASQTGLGSSFVGVALVAASTSLPELSTSLTAVRRGKYEMAVSNILGTNLLEVALFLLADAVYRGGPILAATDRSGMFAGAVGLIVTCLMLLGLLERRDRTVARLGLDSLAILVAYAAGLVGLYHLR